MSSSATPVDTSFADWELPDGTVVASLAKNVELVIYQEIFDECIYSAHVEPLRERACIFDVGANTGLFLLYLNRCLKSARVFAFEPIPDIYQVCRANLDRHNQLDVTLLNVGLSNRSGDTTFMYYPRTHSSSTMYPEAMAEFQQNFEADVAQRIATGGWLQRLAVRAVPPMLWRFIVRRLWKHATTGRPVPCRLQRISDVIREHQVPSIDLLKIDAESSEQDILDGIDDEHWPLVRQVVIEVHGDATRRQAIEACLAARGYTTSSACRTSAGNLHMVSAVREPRFIDPEYNRHPASPNAAL